MDKILTAEEFVNRPFGQKWDTQTLMIEFAKMHCEAQREAILEKVNLRGVSQFDNSPDKIVDGAYEVDSNGPDYNFTVNKESIINAYPLENIK